MNNDLIATIERLLRIIGTVISLMAAAERLRRWWNDHGREVQTPPE